MNKAFAAAVAELVERFGVASLRALAEKIRAGAPDHTVLSVNAQPDFAVLAAEVLVALRSGDVDRGAAVAYFYGVADGYQQQTAQVQVQSVWSGPSSHAVPVRSGAQALIEVVQESTRELAMMTYSARHYPPLATELATAVQRGVNVSVVVETLGGAGSALSGSEPALAFADISGVQLWHWPPSARTERGAKMHAKVAVADGAVLLVSSANLTQAAVGANLEAGLLVRGGSAPERVAEHIAALKSSGVLARLRVGLEGE